MSPTWAMHDPSYINRLIRSSSGLFFEPFLMQSKVKAAQSCPTLCDPMDYTVHGILQARILEWITVPFSRGSFQLGNRNQASHIAGGFFTS